MFTPSKHEGEKEFPTHLLLHHMQNQHQHEICSHCKDMQPEGISSILVASSQAKSIPRMGNISISTSMKYVHIVQTHRGRNFHHRLPRPPCSAYLRLHLFQHAQISSVEVCSYHWGNFSSSYPQRGFLMRVNL